MATKKYGNNNYWAFIEDEPNGKEVAIWKGPEDKERIIGRAVDKYQAIVMVDALLNYVWGDVKIGPKEMAFLEFVEGHCVEPYATMAANAILWKDLDTYKNLVNKFPEIY